MKKVIIFDFDNTLVLSLADWKYMIDHETPKHYGVKENPDFEPKRHGLSNKDTAKFFLEMHPDVKVSHEEIVDYWYDYMAVKYKENIPLIEGAKEFLVALKNKGYKLVLATATGKKLLKRAFPVYDIDKYFDLILCEEEVGKSKREPDIYYKIMEQFGVKVEECLYFEDSCIAIKTASNLGIDCVAVVSDLNKHRQEFFDQTCTMSIEKYSQDVIKKLSL